MGTPIEVLQEALTEVRRSIDANDRQIEDHKNRLLLCMERTASQRATAAGMEEAIRKLGGTI